MIFEFVVVYQSEPQISIMSVLLDRLREVLANNLNEFDDESTARMLSLNSPRSGSQILDEAGLTRTRTVLGFALDLPEETASQRTVVDEFKSALRAAPIEHVLKFEDSLLRRELAQRADEIFSLEMKLRRVLSMIYLQAYQIGSPYDLLRDEAVQPMSKELQPDQMQAAAENQFFHLTFSNYVGLNQRPELKQVSRLLELIRAKDSYETLKNALGRFPVEHEEDAEFIAGLRARMNAIEGMRNCVAHNRHPSKKTAEDYVNALPLVEASLNQFLERWAAR